MLNGGVSGDSLASPWANILSVIETPSLVKISQKQYTFLMHLVDEFGLFLDVLDRTKTQAHLIKQQQQAEATGATRTKASAADLKLTVCLLSPTTFTLAVIDGLEDAMINLSTPAPPLPLPEAELEPTMRDSSNSNVVVDLITTSAPIVASTAKLEPASPAISIVEDTSNPMENLNKGFNLLAQKKTKTEENIQRGLDIASRGSRGSSQSSLSAMNDTGDDVSSQWDQLSEDLDADLDPGLLTQAFEQSQQPEKPARIELDDDSLSLTGKNNTNALVIGTNALESVGLIDDDNDSVRFASSFRSMASSSK